MKDAIDLYAILGIERKASPEEGKNSNIEGQEAAKLTSLRIYQFAERTSSAPSKRTPTSLKRHARKNRKKRRSSAFTVYAAVYTQYLVDS